MWMRKDMAVMQLSKVTDDNEHLKAQLKEAEKVIDDGIKLQSDTYGDGIKTHVEFMFWAIRAKEYKSKHNKDKG